MKNTYITIVPMEMNSFEKKDFQSADGCEIKYNGVPRYFPISSVIEQTYDIGVETKVIAVRFDTDQSDKYLKLLKEEINSIGIKNLTFVEVTVPENQQYQNLVSVFQQVLHNVDDDTDVYACITFGSKIMSLIIAYLLDSLAYLRKNAIVQGVYYLELLRNNGAVINKILYNVTDLVNLNRTIKDIHALQLSDPQNFLDTIINGEE